MSSSNRTAFVERGLRGAAIVIGRTVTRAAGVLPRIVSRASGLADPSPEAVAAGVVRGVTALAPLGLPAAGRAVELAGVASVLALATWTLEAELDDASSSALLEAAIVDVERAGLCGRRAAVFWRMASGVPLEPIAAERALLPDVRRLGRSAVRSLARKAAVRALGSASPLHVLDTGLAAAGAWAAMGDAARLVEATRRIADRASLDGSALIALGP